VQVSITSSPPASINLSKPKKNNPTMSTTQEFNGERTSERPFTLPELRERIAHYLCYKYEPLQSCIERAEQSEKEGRDYSTLDPERAFVGYTRAGYLVLVKLPAHPHYKLLLSESQRRDMLRVCVV